MKKDQLTVESVIFHTLNTIFCLIVIVVMLYPFWNTIAVTFNEAQDTLSGGITFLPRNFTSYGYQTIFKNQLLLIASVNSVLMT